MHACAEAHVPHRVHGGGHEHRQRARALLPPTLDIHGDPERLVGGEEVWYRYGGGEGVERTVTGGAGGRQASQEVWDGGGALRELSPVVDRRARRGMG